MTVKKRRAQVLAGILIAASVPFIVFADTEPEPPPPPPGDEWSASVDVPDTCTVNDSDGAAHTYTGFLGICALQESIESGAIASASLSNAFPTFGLFVTAVNGISANPASEYWALYKNGSFASVGVTQLSIAAGDVIVLELHDFSDTYLDARLTITVNSLVSSPAGSGSSGSGAGTTGIKIIAPDFDVPKAIAFLTAAQSPDGGLPSWLLSDWTAFAFASYGGGGIDALREHAKRSAPAMTNVTDYERHAMALMALGIDPYIGTGTDYITPIVTAFDGTQVGDPVLVNDDIFAVFPLLHAGYMKTDDMLVKIRDGIVAAQKPDGSWEGSVDLTASAVQALTLFDRVLEVKTAIDRAEGYLVASQKDDGGFGNSFSTAWAMQAIAGIGDSHMVWTKGLYRTPRYYLSERQQRDGGVETSDTPSNTRLWATAYAIPGVLGKTWDSIMESFPKPLPPQPVASTPDTASSTPESTVLESIVANTPAPEPEQHLAEELPTEQETVESTTTTASAQVAGAGVIGINEFAWGFTALLALLLIIAVAYSLLRGDRAKAQEKRA
jgi:hypothetical protein